MFAVNFHNRKRIGSAFIADSIRTARGGIMYFRKQITGILSIMLAFSTMFSNVTTLHAEEAEPEETAVTETVEELSEETAEQTEETAEEAEQTAEPAEAVLPEVTEEAEETEEVSEPEQEQAEEELVPEEAAEEITVPSSTEYGTVDADAGTNDELLQMYIDKQLNLDVGQEEATAQGMGDALTGNNLIVYNILKSKVEQVAAGEITSTEFSITLADLGLSGKQWTASELGVDAIVVNNEIADEATEAAKNLININVPDIISRLLVDCPYDLYWFDKTKGYSWKFFTPAARYSNGEWFYYLVDDYSITMIVATEYANGTYTTNPEVISSVGTAVSTIQNVVQTHAAENDYNKLVSYRQDVCSRVSYNDAAASDSTTPYGNPWQLIWVFDGDDSTKVVCEGYSKAFKYLCDLSTFRSKDIECYLVTGTMDGGSGAGNHMWNIVTMNDGKNYLVDVTNCDQGSVGADDWLFLRGVTFTSTNNFKAVIPERTEGNTIYSGATITYGYDSKTAGLYDRSLLTLSSSKYEPSESVSVTGVTLDQTTLTLEKGEDAQLTATVTPADADNKNVTWTSSNTAVAAVDNTGKVTAVGKGTAVITVTTEDGNFTATCAVTVEEHIAVTGVTIDQTTLTLEKGADAQLTATVEPADADNKNVTWTSSDTAVATVDNTGKVTAVGKGTAVITVTTEDGNFTATCAVTVEEHIAVTGVTLDQAELTLEKGTDAQLTATVEPADADNKAITWTSSNTSVAAVDSTGKVTAVGKGTATITVTTEDGEFAASCRVTVEETIAVTSVLLNKTELILTKDEKYTLIAGVLPANATNQNVTWASDHPEIASVDENGTVTGVTDGTAVITVTTEDGNFTVHCNVTVSSTVTRSFEFDYSSYESEEIEAYYHETSEVNFTYTINGKAGDPSELTFAFEDTEHHVGEIKLSDDNSKLLITPELIGYFGLVVKYHDEIIQRAYMNAYGPVYNFRVKDPNENVLWLNVQPEALELSYTFDNAEGDYSSLTVKSSDESVLKAEFSEDHKTVNLTPVSSGDADITFYAPWSAEDIHWHSFAVKEPIQTTGKYLSVAEWRGIEEISEINYEQLDDAANVYSHDLYYYLFVDGVQQDSSDLSIISTDPSVVKLGHKDPEEHVLYYVLTGFGTAEIQFRDGEELLKTITVNNTQPYISSVSMFSKTYVLSAGSTERLRYTLYPSYAIPAERVEYASDNINVVTVDESGLMTGVSEGTASVAVKLYQANGNTVTESVSVAVSSDTITGYGSGNYPYVNAASLVSGEGNQYTLTFRDGYPQNIADGFKISIYLMPESGQEVLYVSAFKPASNGSSYTFNGTDLKKYASDNLEPGNYAVKIKLTKSYNEEMYYFPVMTIDQQITVKAPEDLVI